MELKQLNEKRGELFKELTRFRSKLEDDSFEFSPEEKENWDRLNADFDKLTDRRDALLSLDAAEARYKEETEADEERFRRQGFNPGAGRHIPIEEREERAAEMRSREMRGARDYGGVSDFDLAIAAWARYGRAEIPEREMRAARALRLDPSRKTLELRLLSSAEYREFRSRNMTSLETLGGKEIRYAQYEGRQSGADTTTEAELIAPEFLRSLERAQLTHGVMRQAATIRRTTSGANMPMPTIDDTANAAAIVAEEVTGAGTAGDVDWSSSQVVLHAHKYHARMKISAELEEDSAFDLSSEIGTALGVRLARGTEGHYATGTGTGQPAGITVRARSINDTSAGAVFVPEDVYEVFHDVDPVYRNLSSSAFMAHDAIVKRIRLFRDNSGGAGPPATGQWMWVPGFERERDSLLGRPLFTNNKMPSTVANAQKILVFGDLSKYVIREVRGIRLKRLDELFADTDQIGFFLYWRGDGDLVVWNQASPAASAVSVLNIAT